MKNNIVIFSLAMLFCLGIFSGCSTNEGKNAESKTNSAISSTVNSTVSMASKVTSDTMSTVSSTLHTLRADYRDWTYEDWQIADDNQKENCRQYFSNAISQETTIENLGKIFGTNQDKNLTQIIENQKSIINNTSSDANNSVIDNSSSTFIQPDPGHGAAAGY